MTANIMLNDGPIPEKGKVIGWRDVEGGRVAAIIANPLTRRRFLFDLDPTSGRLRYLRSL